MATRTRRARILADAGAEMERTDVAIGTSRKAPGLNPETDVAAEVAARPPSPVREEMPARHEREPRIPIEHHSDGEYNWTRVQHTRAHSLDSARIDRVNKVSSHEITTEHIERAIEADDNAEPSVAKGKQTDPREWGNLELSEEEINIEAQAAALKAYKACLRKYGGTKSKNPKKSKEKYKESDDDTDFEIPKVSRHHSVSTAGHANRIETRRAGSRPAAQLVPTSSLGAALTGIASKFGNRAPKAHQPKEDGSSPSSSEFESDGSDGSESDEDYRREHQKEKSRKRKQKKGQKNSHQRENTIKPIPPKEYNGAADPRAYHRFVMEGEAYLRDG